MATGNGRKRRGSAHTPDKETESSAPPGGRTPPKPVEVAVTREASVDDPLPERRTGEDGLSGADGQERSYRGKRRLAVLAVIGLTVAGLAGVLAYQMALGDAVGLWSRLSVAQEDGAPPARSSDVAAHGVAADVLMTDIPNPPEASVTHAGSTVMRLPAESPSVPPSPVPAALPQPQPQPLPPPLPQPASSPERSGSKHPPARLAVASPIPQRKPKPVPSKAAGTPVMAVPTVAAAPAGAAVVLTVGQSTVGGTLRVLGPGSSDRFWPDRTREIAYRFGRPRILVEGMAATGVTLWFDPQGVLAAARFQEPELGLLGNSSSVAVLPAMMAGY